MSAAAGPVVRLLEPLIVPAVFDFWAQKVNPTFSWERCLARVVARHMEARDTVTLELQANRHFPGFRAGQHLNLSVEVDGVRLTRCYSPVTPPSDDRRFAVTVRREPGGRVSGYLVDHVRPGDVIEVGPGGAFGELLPNAPVPPGPWLLVAGGSGITPLWSMAQWLLAERPDTEVHLFYWVRQRQDLCFQSGLLALRARHPNLTVTTVLTGDSPELDGELQGRPQAHHFAALAARLSECHARVCGSREFVASVTSLLSESVADLASEAFSRPQPGPAQGHVSVTLARSGRTVSVPAGVSLLEGLEQAGLSPAYGCRRGICNTCACHKQAGATEGLVDGRLNSEAGEVRLCISAPRSDIALEL